MKIVSLCLFLLAILFFANQTEAQTVTTGSVSGTAFCTGTTFTVTYTASGYSDTTNTFNAQLSDASGSFNTFDNIGNTQSISSGTISCKIPDNTTTGTKYRVRVISTVPYITGSDNGVDIGIYQYPQPSFNVTNLNRFPFIKVGDYIQFALYSETGNVIIDSSATYFWEFGDGSSPQNFTGFNPPPVQYNKAGKINPTLTITNIIGCSKSTSNSSISVLDCTIKIDSTAFVVDTIVNNLGLFGYGYVNECWITTKGIVNGGIIQGGSNPFITIFIEAGGALNADRIEEGVIIYIKPGGSVNVTRMMGTAIIQSGGASIKISDPMGYGYDTTIIHCSDVKFEYKNAPLKGILAMKINGVEDNSINGDAINIYPNPSTGIFNISCKDITTGQVIITDALGNNVLDMNLNDNNSDVQNMDMTPIVSSSALSRRLYIDVTASLLSP